MMANSDDYQAKIAEIEAIPDDELKSPNMPVDVFLQEIENSSKWVQEDNDRLITAGLDWNLVEDLSMRAGALREAQSLWFRARFAREEAEKEWKTKAPEAYDLRDTLLHDFHFAFRNDPNLAKRVSAIAEGSGHADMIQDLNDLALLGKKHVEELTKIGFDMTLLDQAAVVSDEMASLLSSITTDRADRSVERIIRDKVFIYAKQAIDEIRACGQYVFWRDDERLKGYVSHYFRSRRKKGPASDKTGDAASG